ncbi:MAG: hypothetical protein HGA31_02545 [Candidatus Moranbacteria bacterium]|nr:hypothetical protein [Candidatus Moranbacteria bacterium]
MNGKRIIIPVLGLCLVAFIFLAIGRGAQEESPVPKDVPEQTAASADDAVVEGSDIKVTLPISGAVITSPVKLTGEAAGNWFSEGSFPVSIVDGNGDMLGSGTAQATGDWMMEGPVPFQAEVTFDPKGAGTGAIVFSKDNPSGLPEHAESFLVPVSFGT